MFKILNSEHEQWLVSINHLMSSRIMQYREIKYLYSLNILSCNFYNGIPILHSLKPKSDSWHISLIMHMLNILNASNTNKTLVLPCVNWKITNATGDIILNGFPINKVLIQLVIYCLKQVYMSYSEYITTKKNPQVLAQQRSYQRGLFLSKHVFIWFILLQ